MFEDIRDIMVATIDVDGEKLTFQAVAEALGAHVITDRPLSLGGDNFAEYLNAVPGCYAYLGTADPARPETLNGLHCGSFDVAEDALVTGAALYAGAALNWLTGSVEL